MSRVSILAEIHAERDRQIEKGYDATHDDSVGPALIWKWSFERVEDAIRHDGDIRKAYLEAAAMLCATVELFDRWDEAQDRK